MLVMASTVSNAQNWQWAKGAGGSADDEAHSIARDTSGNVLVAGFYSSATITFGMFTLTNTGGEDIFLVKYDVSGNVLWAKNFGGTGDDEAISVAVDDSNHIIVTGNYTSSALVFGSTTLTNTGGDDIFLYKCDANGNVIWAKSAGGTDSDNSTCVTTDASGNILITGGFQSPTLIFGSSTLTCSGGMTLFLAKYNSAGTVLWAKTAGGDAWDYAVSVTTDTSENVYMTGDFTSPTLVFGSTTLTNAGTGGYYDMFLVKYNSAGTVQWAKSNGGTNSDVGRSVTIDHTGNVILTGYFGSSSMVFGSTTLTKTSGSENLYIVKYTSSGTVVWAKSAGGDGSDWPTSVNTDTTGNIYMSGNFSGTSLVFGSTTLTNADTSGFYEDIFIAKYNASGTLLWAKKAGGTSMDRTYCATVDASGSVFLTGVFMSPTLAFGFTTLTNAGNQDMFLAKMGSSIGINEISDPLNISLFPNPASEKIQIISEKFKVKSLEIYNMQCQQMMQVQFQNQNNIELDVSMLAKGIYLIKIQSENGMTNKKLVIQ